MAFLDRLRGLPNALSKTTNPVAQNAITTAQTRLQGGFMDRPQNVGNPAAPSKPNAVAPTPPVETPPAAAPQVAPQPQQPQQANLPWGQPDFTKVLQALQKFGITGFTFNGRNFNANPQDPNMFSEQQQQQGIPWGPGHPRWGEQWLPWWRNK